MSQRFFLILCCLSAVVSNMDALFVAKDAFPCGVEASSSLIHHNPWMVFLEYLDSEGSVLGVRCGGTLVSSRHVVTAAHCVKKGLFHRLIARLGEYDLNAERDCVGSVCADAAVRIAVSRVRIPDGYDGSEDDIAVLELEEDAEYTDFIRPICLPSQSEDKILSEKVTFSAAGWGELAGTHIYSHIKKIIPLPAWTTENCRLVYKNLRLPKNIICAGGQDSIDTCRGDSGGPLTLIAGRIELWGVTSSGNVHCGTKGSPGIYTSVVKHLDWIKKVTSLD